MPLEPSKMSRFTGKELMLLVLAVAVSLLVVPGVITLSLITNGYFHNVLVLKTWLEPITGVWWLIVPMLLGGLAVGLIVHKIAPEAQGPGTNIVINAFHKRSGRLRPRTAPSKFGATLLTVGSGSPSGLVSPSMLLGKSVSSYVGRILALEREKQKTLSLCGVSAAISALLNAPIGAAIFAVEVVYGDRILYRRFFYCLASSLTGYILSTAAGFRGIYSVLVS